MKFTFVFFISILFSISVQSQEVIGVTGDFDTTTTTSTSVAWTIGEPIIETFESPNIDVALTQGFHQSGFQIVFVEEKPARDINTKIYPNPALGYFNIEFTGILPDEAQYMMYDFTGKLVREGTINSQIQRVELGNLANAQYILKIKSNKLDYEKTYRLQKIQ
ncbi:T9SS type A sorting domain-containing protein [Salibacter halophilus]|uniref:T9SS type A sorting domain-containing protein n=1 Tax=Salibacter halophilus TaxID=1803916 RepID=A0A6N6M739_9FLAO|nr:T9SS type A sorting domain-containing protein [Salibacter halophilus]KAB1063774.1 T9SS type A sorting domain-containing protein [Salibacter halophilus]